MFPAIWNFSNCKCTLSFSRSWFLINSKVGHMLGNVSSIKTFINYTKALLLSGWLVVWWHEHLIYFARKIWISILKALSSCYVKAVSCIKYQKKPLIYGSFFDQWLRHYQIKLVHTLPQNCKLFFTSNNMACGLSLIYITTYIGEACLSWGTMNRTSVVENLVAELFPSVQSRKR